MDKRIMKQFLKSGFIYEGNLFPTNIGSPQGGAISSLYANMTLDGLEKLIQNKYHRNSKGKIENHWLPPEMVKKCLSRMSGKLSRTVLRRGKGSNPFSLVDYCSNDYQLLLKRNKISPSMSRKGNPYDNAVAENFFSNMKCECTNFYSFRTRVEATQTIFEYIEVYYNRQRRHSGCSWIPPKKYKQLLLSKAA